MSMTVDITPYSDFLLVTMAGDFSLTETEQAVVSVFKALARYNLQKLLVDFRQLNGEPTILETFEHVSFLSKEMNFAASVDGVSRSTKIAYVGAMPMISKQRFAETMAFNRGIIIKITDNMEAALQWLDIDSANKAVVSDT